MFKKYLLITIIILSLIVSFILPATLSAEPVNGNPARLLVTFDEQARQAVKDFIQDKNGQVVRDFKIIPGMAISLGSEQMSSLMSLKGVRKVGIDGRVYASDTELDRSWGVKRIGAGDVHPNNTGSINGNGVNIAIIDTGIDYTHPDLDANYAGGYDFVNNDTQPLDDNGHGTHVAGIVAAEDNNSGVVGVAPEADLYALKALDANGSGYWSDIMAALEWAIYNNIQVVNMSLGSSSDAPGLHDIVIAAYNAGIVLVAAAGNSGNPSGRTDSIEYPARYTEVIAVGATDQNDSRAKFSSTGALLELVAPGVSIYSTVPGGYASYSGTSMASPHVAGTVALIIASGISNNNEVRTMLQTTADDLGATGKDIQYGYGIVNAYEAVLPPLATGSIQGTVTDGANPMVGATVTDGTRTSTTGIDGYYLIKDVPDGTYTVTASADTYKTDSQQVSIIDGAVVTANFVLVKVLNGTITGIVKDASTNLPIDGASVTNGNKTTTTDSNGVYTIFDIPGTYTVTASANGYQSLSQTVEVQEDITSTVDFDLEIVTQTSIHVENIFMSYSVSGVNYFIYTNITIKDKDSTPVSAATVYINLTLSNGSNMSVYGQTNTEGVAAFKIKSKQNGTYTSEVINVVKDGFIYNQSDNVITTSTVTVP